ncbi:MAG: O-antigen ligase family protein [Desulfobacter sp.]|nr:MAG: O-antigen ligase family protein [Desulfobacter sp.]
MRLNPLFLARMLILLEIIALAVSTAATVVVEILIFITVLGFKDLRMRLLTSLRQPMVIMSMVLLAMVGLGIFYSIAPFSEGMDMWASWRKYLMVPFVVALYDDPKWKERFALVFIGLMSLAAFISLAGVLFDFTIYYRFPVGIVVDNHATQGMFFSAAVFACLILLRFPPKEFKTPSWTLITAIILITLSIFLATPGRSGYLAFMVYITVFLFWSVRGIKRVLLMALAPVVIIMMLIASPVARDRIKLGFSEMQTYKQDKTVTSMGLRVIWWKNTLAILKKAEQPVFGYGTSGFEHAYAAHVKGQTGWQGKPTTSS